MTRAAPQNQIADIMRAIRAGNIESAVSAGRTLVQSYPDDPNALAILATAQSRSGELDAAIAGTTRAVELAGAARTDIRLALAQLLRSAGRTERAIEEFQSVAESSDDPEAWYGLALCYEQSRRFEEARSAAQRVLRTRPDHPLARLTMARTLRGLGQVNEALDELSSMDARKCPAVIAVHLHTERGHCLDQLKRYDDAFSEFAKANAAFDAMPETMRISKSVFPSMLDATSTLLNSSDWVSRAVQPDATDRKPVFVVGFPRSGTTMLEQMLGAHSQTITSDEAPFIRDLVREIAAIDRYPESLLSLDVAKCAELQEKYWSLARRRLGADVDTKVLVDKQPLNIAYLACIGSVFPGAKVIVVLRDPMDAVLSCFMQAFTPNQATVHLSSVSRASALYGRVMGLWLDTRDRCGVDPLVVRYEDVIGNPREEISRCLSHIGLSWEESIESFHERIGRKFVSTPSYLSVAQPISRKSVGRWDRYHDRVKGALQTLERFRIEFGYGRSD